MAEAFLWCQHCGQPHPVGFTSCPTTHKPLSTRVHKEPRVATPATAIRPNELPDVVGTDNVIDGRYRLRKLLGEGATSRVYVADDTALQKNVAVKILRPTIGRGRAFLRFEQEARVMLSISHPNVCRVLSFGRLPDTRPFLVLELVEGKTLFKVMRQRGQLDHRVAFAIVKQLLIGLGAIHQLGIVHRDIKPSNIFLAKEDGGVGRVKLLDFGLAKPPAASAIVVTRPGSAFGTPGYAAPEILSGGPASPTCDIWSTGIVLFELLAGVRPFRDPTPGSSAFVVACGPRLNLRDYVPSASDELIAVIEDALRMDPAARIPNAYEFADRLAGIADELGPLSTTLPISDTGAFPQVDTGVIPVIDQTSIQSVDSDATEHTDTPTGVTPPRG